MIIKIILTIVFIILIVLLYFLFIPIGFALTGDFDEKYFKASLHDPLRFINLRYDTAEEEKFSLKLFYFVKIGGEKKDKDSKKKKKKKHKKKDSPEDEKKPGKKNKFLSFIKKRLTVIIKSIFSFLKKCRIHVSDCDVAFSTGEPDTSALIYGGIASLPFMYGKNIRVDADLLSDDAFIKGHIKVSGSIFICILLYYCVRIVTTKGE